jgi:hypothetical protein
MASQPSKLLILLFPLLLFVAHPSPAQEASGNVSVSVATFRSTNREVVYKIGYRYEFPGRESVFIENIGLVPAKGRLTYFSYDSNLIFRESSSGRILIMVSLLGPEVHTSVVSGPDFPDASEFSKSYRTGRWTSSTSFQSIANDLLNKTFLSGYRAYSANNVNYLQTTYTPLRDLPPNLLAQIAVLVSHPYNPGNKQFEYHVQFVVREKRIQSGSWRYEIGEDSRKSAEQFISQLISKLEESGRKRK